MQIHSVGIDLGKTTFHLVALGDNGKVLLKKKFTQKQLIAFTANMQTCLIGMEACSGSHFLGRALRAQGHDVKLIPAQFVKPFVKSNKNDFIDAEAIAEAVNDKLPPSGPPRRARLSAAVGTCDCAMKAACSTERSAAKYSWNWMEFPTFATELGGQALLGASRH